MRKLAMITLAISLVSCGDAHMSDVPDEEPAASLTSPPSTGQSSTTSPGDVTSQQQKDASADTTTTDPDAASTTPTVPPIPPTTEPATVLATVPGLAELVASVAEEASVPEDAVTVVRAQRVVWSDASLGCPEGGMMYAQVLTDGYWVVLQAGGAKYDFRSTLDASYRRCIDGAPPADVLVDR